MKSTSSSMENKTCAICLGSMETGQGQAIFTAECSHSFHFSCIGNTVAHRKPHCPICHSKWNNLPFSMPNNPPTPTPTPPFSIPSQRRPPLTRPVFEPLQFSDDEPLPSLALDAASSASSTSLQKVSIITIPERPALAASKTEDNFSILLKLRAPSLSENDSQNQRAPIDLVTVLDVSGSMCGSKLDLVKRAVIFVIDNLGPSDRISLVSFSSVAQRILPLCRMTENGRENAKRAVNLLSASGSTNIVEGLKKGVKVLEERRQRNPVATIIFLSDGNDNCNHGSQSHAGQPPQYLSLLPSSIHPGSGGLVPEQTFPVHAFGFGTDHDPLAMHAIANASAGTFSFIESYEMVQDAFASCIGGLLSVMTQELRVMMRAASNGVEIKSIPSGSYASEISNEGYQGTINVGELYADEKKEFLINLSVPVLLNGENEPKTSLLDITCSYKDVVSNEMVNIECELVEIQRPEFLVPSDVIVNMEVDRQRNRLNAAEGIAEAQRMAETGNFTGAQAVLSNGRSIILDSPSGQAGDGLCLWLEREMKEMEDRMGNQQSYERRGRAYALANMSSHASQRATTNSRDMKISGGAPAISSRAFANQYMTPNMTNMVMQSQQGKIDNVIPKKD